MRGVRVPRVKEYTAMMMNAWIPAWILAAPALGILILSVLFSGSSRS
jgi:hypothetical protein